jgi:hypothetical protein
MSKEIIYTKPNFQDEWEEAIRYPEFKQMGIKNWYDVAGQGYTTKYSKIKDVLGNVDLDFDNLNTDKQDRFWKAYTSGKVELPIVVKFADNDYDLLGGNTRLSGLIYYGIDPTVWVVDLDAFSKKMVNMAHQNITRIKGKEYAPDAQELGAWIVKYLESTGGLFTADLDEAKKTDYSREKSQGLHCWFARRGGGGSSGWVDCNTCRRDPETGRKKCKPCGRQDGEKRKYPACRPTPASCGTRGKGKKWGKKSHNENVVKESIDKIAGVWNTNEKFSDGTEFKIKFKVSDIIDLAKDKPVRELRPSEINYDFSGRQEDPLETNKRVMNADLSYPIIVVKNENNKIFAMLDGTHRLEKALNLGLDKIPAKILDKEDLIKFKTDNLNEKSMKNLIKQKLHEMVEEGHGEFQNYMFFNNLKTIKDAIDEILQMDANAVDQLLSDGHNWATDHIATSADDIDEVYHFLSATLGEHEPDSYDGETEVGYNDEYGSVESVPMNEAEYKGRKVQLGKPTRGDVKKYKVFVKNAKGKVVKVNFGDKKMEIKRDNPKRRKSFRARHKCAQAKDRTSPKYWSCRMWSRKPVSKIVGENFGFDENSRIFVQNENMTQPATKPLVPETKPRTTEPNKPAQPSRKNKPFLPEVAPGIKTDPKAITAGKFPDFETYHKTLASTLDAIRKHVEARGYDPIEFDMPEIEHVAYGTTRRIEKQLSIGGIPKRNKYLHAQIYRMDGGTYELNMYVG